LTSIVAPACGPVSSSVAAFVSRPIQAHIDLAALRHNFAVVRRHAPASKILAVVKADAYGHGLDRVAATLADRTDGFALLEVSAALQLRAAGHRHPVLLLEGFFAPADVPLLARYGIASVVHCREQVDMLLADPQAGLSLFLKLNTGMNRLGFTPAGLQAAHAALSALPGVRLNFATHFATADMATGVAEQFAFFNRHVTFPGAASLANSAAILRHPQTHRDWVRPGIMLYGSSPFADTDAAAFDLRPVMTLDSRLLAVQEVPAGGAVGYGGTFVAERPTRVGVVACGYADGYPRHAATGTPIAVGGHETRTLGRVSMDMLACDITDIPQATVGSPVTLWGHGAGGMVAADRVAAAAGTISYELFTALAPRVPVAVVDAGND
jgi:alanine racemase